MKNSTRAALWSALVLPGVGQIVLKRYTRGIALLLVTSAAIVWIAVKAAEAALAILGKLQAAGGTISLQALTGITNQASAAASSFSLNAALYLIIFCWIFGTVDAYRIGKQMDRREAPAQQATKVDGG